MQMADPRSAQTNITIDADGGHILIQEDPGNQSHVARIVAYRITDGRTAVVARFDPALFDPSVAGSGLITQDEESSGIIDVTGIWFRPPTDTQGALEYADNVLGRGKGGTFRSTPRCARPTGSTTPLHRWSEASCSS